MKKQYRKKKYLLLALICLLLTGCGMGEGTEAGGETGSEASVVEEQKEGTSPELPAEGNSQDNKAYYVGKVDTQQFQKPEEGYTEHTASYKVIGDHIYMIRVESKVGGSASRVCVQSYDVNTKDMRQYLIEPEISGHEDSSIYSADLTAGLELSLKMRDTGDKDAFYLVRMNLEGEVLRVEDTFSRAHIPGIRICGPMWKLLIYPMAGRSSVAMIFRHLPPVCPGIGRTRGRSLWERWTMRVYGL